MKIYWQSCTGYCSRRSPGDGIYLCRKLFLRIASRGIQCISSELPEGTAVRQPHFSILQYNTNNIMQDIHSAQAASHCQCLIRLSQQVKAPHRGISIPVTESTVYRKVIFSLHIFIRILLYTRGKPFPRLSFAQLAAHKPRSCL